MFGFRNKNKIKTTITENFNYLEFRVTNIGNDKEIIINNIIEINEILNQKYKDNGISFFVDPSYEKGFAVSIEGLNNQIGASLRIKYDSNILDKNRKQTFFSDGIQNFYSFVAYDIRHKEEYDLLMEAAELYINKYRKG